jgi:hypothetical protein
VAVFFLDERFHLLQIVLEHRVGVLTFRIREAMPKRSSQVIVLKIDLQKRGTLMAGLKGERQGALDR